MAKSHCKFRRLITLIVLRFEMAGKTHRKRLPLIKINRMFSDNKVAEGWFLRMFWPEGPARPDCGSINVQSNYKHKTIPYRCGEKQCGKEFSLRTGAIMQSSKLSYQAWAMVIYILTAGIKRVSSMKLHGDLDITQKSAWHLAHRIRKSWDLDSQVNLIAKRLEGERLKYRALAA